MRTPFGIKGKTTFGLYQPRSWRNGHIINSLTACAMANGAKPQRLFLTRAEVPLKRAS
jgi:hypothetical protein